MSKEMSDIILATKLTADIISEKISDIHVAKVDEFAKEMSNIYGKIFEKVLSAVQEMNIPTDYPSVANIRC